MTRVPTARPDLPAGFAAGALEASALAAVDPESRLRLARSSWEGLGSAEAAIRLRALGPNEPVRRTSANRLRQFGLQFVHTLALLLWFAAGLAFAADIPELGAAIVAVVLVNGIFASAQEYRAEQVVEGLMRRVALTARVIRDGPVTTVPAAELVPGDLVELAAGGIVPADCILLRSDALSADLSMLTGETLPVDRSAEAVETQSPGTHLADFTSILPAGAGVVTGTGLAMVFATGQSSSIGVVAELVESSRRETSVLEQQIAALSRQTAIIAVLSGAVTLFLVAITSDTTVLAALTFGTGVIVALVPEGLLPTLSVSLAIGARRMAERGAAVRRLSAVEVVGSVSVICSDKTGTLTENSLTVTGVSTATASPVNRHLMLLAAALCNDASEEDERLAGDALDVALWRWVQKQGADPAGMRTNAPRIETVPFDARRRYMAVTCDVDGVRWEFVKGAPESVLALFGISEPPETLAASLEEATGLGERVLMLAAKTGDQPPLLGVARFEDPPRAGVAEAIASCRTAGVRVVMLTGDHPGTARAVARAVGLGGGDITVVEGSAIDAMTDSSLRELLATDAIVARVDPQQKLRIVKALQAAGEVVIVTGDGVNDAPALRAADVGIAMGLRGTEVAKQAADIVLSDDNFVTIVAAIEEGRSIRSNIRRFISYVVTSNVAEMLPFLLYVLLPIPLPLAVIQALAVDLGTDLLPALALGAEPPTKDTLDAAPEPRSRPLLTRQIAFKTFFFFGLMEASLGLSGFFLYFLVHGWTPGESFGAFDHLAGEAATVTFLGIVGGQIGCLFAQRDGNFVQRLHLGGNRLIPLGLAFEIIVALVLVYVPGVNGVFSMSAVSLAWLLAIPVAATIFVLLDQVRRSISAKGSRSIAPGSTVAVELR